MNRTSSLASFLFAFLVMSSCQATLSGSWTGRLESPNAVGVRFTIEDKNGDLSGMAYWEDPDTKQLEPEGEIAGKRDNSDASWMTDGLVRVQGRFDGNSFVGTATFPADGDEPERVVPLRLSR